MKIEVPSYHESINRMYEKVKKETTNVVDRFNEQEKIRCPFCTKGLSCQLCSMGPCRISEKIPYGACGIDAAGMVMRNLVFKNMLGTEAYTYHAIDAAKTLKATAEGKTPFEIKEVEKLKWLANLLGISGKDEKEIAIKVADFVIADLSSINKSRLVEILSLKKRREIWNNLGIDAGGVFGELLTVGTSVMTNVDSNYVSLAKKSISMSIPTCIAAQFVLEMIQDILFGTPMPHESFADLGILDPSYVNVAVDGHEPFVGMALIKLAEKEEIQEMARKAGAKGLKIIGFIETGQEILQRTTSPVFAGIVGNWISQEFALATGCIDVFAADMNCALPSLPEYQKYGVKIVPVSKLVRFRGINEGLDYKPEEVEKIAMKLIEIAIENFKKRDKSKAVKIERKQKILVGFSNEAVEKLVGIDNLLNAIKDGKIKGVVALVSCTTLKNGPHDANTVAIAKELIKRNILVLSMGCGNAALQVAGLTSFEAKEIAGENLKALCETLKIPPVLSFGTCTDVGRVAYLLRILAEKLGVDIPQLPIAATAPEYMEQKATIDAVFAVAYGVTTHVSPIPPITGSEKVVKLLTDEVEKLTGGKILFEEDPVKAAEKIEKVIVEKRKALGI
ncbi:MAG: anaerobic carbon-monoxide dehydrogenase catalytic subunit [Archaeoglobaceae archaeon]|nr:anaerobic carbon-monoxide dehydrogenase catalytic subunit [Archaeoglobaceae archaeon]MCX8152729.1 anaerobic carbon-monoxide dehydrogenase catalytic subunit [Archaeoglobaceae archaeon]MDW8013436.1 anaerobic carbon-monoxide dehydrogenase catalytic subunit [Archaeoglobaceae archaeon]